MNHPFASFARISFVTLAVLGVLNATRAASPRTVAVPEPAWIPALAGGGDSVNPLLSPDGRYLLFASSAKNLAVTASNTPFLAPDVQRMNVYLRDRTTGATTLVSVNFDGTASGNGDSLPAGISPDGRYALFESTAGNLIAGDSNGASDLFLRDMAQGTTRLVSARAKGGWANRGSGNAMLTPDARFIAFSSAASDMTEDDTNGIANVFVRDMQSGTTVLASPGATAGSADASSDSPVITPEGRFVAFVSTATNLVPQATGPSEIYVRDLVSKVTLLASSGAHDWISTNPVAYGQLISDDGRYVVYQANQRGNTTSGFVFRYNVASGLTDMITSNAVAMISGPSFFHNLDMTPDGRFITFVARPDATPQSTNVCVYLWDGQTGVTTLVSADTNGATTATSLCEWPAIDANGQRIAFLSTAVNLTTNAVLGEYHLYVRDLQAGATWLVDAGPDGSACPKAFLSPPRMSPDGRFLAFDCTDSDLAAGDNNRGYDVFARDLAADAAELVSVRHSVLPSETAAGSSCRPSVALSGDGRWIVFGSAADNLVPGYTNSPGLFVRDLANGTNGLVNIGLSGLPVPGWFTEPSISADGRWVAFSSTTNNLARNDSNSMQDVFVRDMQLGTNYLVSISSSGTSAGNNPSSLPSLSASGQHILFRSRATTLTTAPFFGENVFWRDLQLGRTFAVTTSGGACGAMTPDGRFVAYGRATGGMYLWDSQTTTTIFTNSTSVLSNIAVSAGGTRLAGQSGSRIYVADRGAGTNWTIAASGPTAWISRANLQFSADGESLVYVTAAALESGDTNGATDVYVYDFQTRNNLLVSRSYARDGAGNGASDSPVISANGRYVAYRSVASDLVPGDTNGVADVFFYDRKTGSTCLLSVSAAGSFAANNSSFAPVFSADGQTLVFQSWASDLVAHDFNQAGDIFALKIATPGTIEPFPCDIVFAPADRQPPTLSWPTQEGASYRVEFKTELSDPSWQDLPGATISVLGSRAYATDLSPGSSQRFYRVVAY